MDREEDVLIRQIMRLLSRAARNGAVGCDAFADARIWPDRRAVLGLGIAAGLGSIGTARAEDVSDWVATDHARIRIIDAGPQGTARLAGLQIELDPDFLTYWRTPGEAGVPPTAVFDGSRNLAAATLAYPAPQRFDEGGAEAFGYKDGVVFPISVTPSDPHAPVSLAIALSFAVCSTLCLPASADLRLILDGRSVSPEAGLVRDALRRVPIASPLGAAGPLAVLSVASEPAQSRAQVLVRAPAGSSPSLFVEAADPWYIQAGLGQPTGDGQVRFDCRVLAGAKVPARIPAALTLVTAEAAVETAVQLDVAAPTP